MGGALADRGLPPGAPPGPEEALLAEVRAGGSDFSSVVFTRNRRVLVSAGRGGATLRLHECFRDAPPEALRAVGRLFAARTAADRAAARERLRAFVESRPRSEAPPVRRPRRPARGDRPHLERLGAEFDRVNAAFFDGALPSVPIHLSGRMRRRNGHFFPDPPEIVVSRALCTRAAEGEAERTLRHEMIHLWQLVAGSRLGHGPDFRRWAARLEVHPRATRPVEWK